VVTLDDVRGLQRAVDEVYRDRLILQWIVELTHATRELEAVALGASVRASLALERISRAWALVNGRDFVTPEDVEALFLPVLGHRIVFTPSFVADARETGTDEAYARFHDLVFSRVARPRPTAAETLRVLGPPAE
jgi:MoxR-like ATPase